MEPYVQVINSSKLGEGPHWDGTKRELLYVDIEGSSVLRYNPVTKEQGKVTIVGQGGVSLVVPVNGETDQYIISTGRDLQRMVWDGVSSAPTSLTRILSIDAEFPNSRFNDGKCDNWGRLWAGSMSNGGNLPDATLYRIQRGIATAMEPGIRISNGIAWTSDNSLMYYIDTPTRKVDVFDFNGVAGTIGNRRTVYDFDQAGEEPGASPDGMTIDANGHLYVGCWGGYQMIHIDPTTGRKVKSIPFPTANITSAAFGGENLDTLFVTSATSGLSQIDLAGQPAAGSLFQVTNLGVRGQAAGNNYIT